MGARKPPLKERLPKLYLLKADTGCWIWQKYITKDGYGQIGLDYKIQYAHRVVYELLVGPIPEGKHLDHLCRNRACINPEHLEPVTCQENILRGIGPTAQKAKQTHCSRGHEFTPENTYHHPNRYHGSRRCYVCIKQYSKKQWAKRKKLAEIDDFALDC